MEYEFKSLRALRGRESSAKAKWQDQGWELVSESRGTLRTELSFRRPKAKTIGAHLLRFAAAFRRLQPKNQLVVVASCALILVAGITGITASTAPPAEPPVTDISVDALGDRLNAANMGGIKNGDRFRVTGELVGAEHWGIGASGDYFVFLKTTVGSDLIVFVQESEADGWREGTKVEMVLKTVEATIRGETTDNWLRAQSARTISD